MDSLRTKSIQRAGHRRIVGTVAFATTLLATFALAGPAAAGGHGHKNKHGHKKEVKVIERIIERERVIERERDREMTNEQTRGIERIERRRRKGLRYRQVFCGCPNDAGYAEGYAAGVAAAGASSYHAAPIAAPAYVEPVPVQHREIHVMPRFSARYSAPAYAATSRAPTITYHAPYEDHYEGSVIGGTKVRTYSVYPNGIPPYGAKVITLPPIMRKVHRSHHYGHGKRHW